MSRWRPGARERLATAALELFVHQGFAQTTVPQITERAGLTTRTFFRHFADKREVLFEHEDDLPALVDSQMAAAPAGLEPMVLISAGLQEVVESRFGGRHQQLRTRRAVIRSDTGLQERELRKSKILVEAITRGFRARGLDDLRSALAAQIAVASLNVAIDLWLDSDDPPPLTTLVSLALTTLSSITAGSHDPGVFRSESGRARVRS